MKQINIHEAKTHLSRLIERAAGGEPFVIAKAGQPMVKVIPLDAPKSIRRLGFMTGEITVPEDYERMAESEIEDLFGGTG